MKPILKYILGVILTAWCLGNIIDGLGVHNWYELVIGYSIFVLPFALLLLYLSRNKEENKLRKNIGIYTSVILIALPIIHIIYVLITYY